jgi:voltage-gated potassium channel
MNIKNKTDFDQPLTGWRLKIHEIIFEAETFWGKWFDILLLVLILFSVLTVMLESVAEFEEDYKKLFTIAEWTVTLLFSIEYAMRLLSIKKPWSYVFSFYGVIDILSIVPTYLAIFISGTQSLMVIRVFRLVRIFRILKLARFLGEADVLVDAIKSSMPKVTVFLVTVISMSLIAGTLMYLIEGEDSGFTSIPTSWYWAIVTMTTVGYGDITPQTAFGQVLASLIMLSGYGILAVPTGIVSAELAFRKNKSVSVRSCLSCCVEGHDHHAKFCFDCGEELS